MINETWIVHCLYVGNGRSLIGVADSRKNANKLRKEMCADLAYSDEFCSENFSCTTKKVTRPNTMVIDLT